MLKNGMAMIAAFGVILLMLVFIYYGDNGLTDLEQMKKTRDRMIQKNDALVRENHSLFRKIDRLKNDMSYIEQIARHELGLVGKNEVIYKFDNIQKKGPDHEQR